MTNQARRFTADDFEIEAHGFDSEYHDRWADMMRQAASTEAQVAGLVEVLAKCLDWVNEDSQAYEDAREALSKFRGEDHV